MRRSDQLRDTPLMQVYLNARRAVRTGDGTCLTGKDLMVIQDVLSGLVALESYAVDHSVPESIFGYRAARIHRTYLKYLIEIIEGAIVD